MHLGSACTNKDYNTGLRLFALVGRSCRSTCFTLNSTLKMANIFLPIAQKNAKRTRIAVYLWDSLKGKICL